MTSYFHIAMEYFEPLNQQQREVKADIQKEFDLQSCEDSRKTELISQLVDALENAMDWNWGEERGDIPQLIVMQCEEALKAATVSEGQTDDVHCYECIHGIPCKAHDKPPFERVP